MPTERSGAGSQARRRRRMMKGLDRGTVLVGLASWSAVALLLGLGLLGWPSRAALLGWLGVAVGSGLVMLTWWWVLGRLLARLSRVPESVPTTLQSIGLHGASRQWSSAGASRLAAWTFAPLAAGWLVALIALASPELHHNLIHSTTIQRRFIFLLAARCWRRSTCCSGHTPAAAG